MSERAMPSGAWQIDQVCDAFETEWRAGRRPRIEPFLERVAPEQREGLLRELLALEVEYRLRGGEQFSASDYQERFPAASATVRDLLADALPSTGLTLTVVDGPYKGQTFSFPNHEYVVAGRARTAHLRPEDSNFAPCHFFVTIDPSSCRLTDLGSRLGTAVNGRPVQSVELRDGDTIRVGQTQFCVTLSASRAAAVLPTTDYKTVPGHVSDRADATVPKTLPPTQPHAVGFPTASFPRVPGYEILRELGRGGMGVVYLARRRADGMLVALKTIIPAVAVNLNQIQRFLREVDIVRKLKDPNREEALHIVHFLDSGQFEDGLFFAMEYVEGTDASQLVKKGPLPVREALRILCQVLKGLAYAHGEGFVHRDIKPANILIAESADRKIAKLADFGLARVYQESRMSGLTMQGEIGGTLLFMPPEQITHFRRVKPAADQYSASATLYNLLTNRYLFDLDKNPASRLTLIQHGEPTPIRQHRPEIPPELATAIHRALAKAPADRFPDVLAFRTALKPFAR